MAPSENEGIHELGGNTQIVAAGAAGDEEDRDPLRFRHVEQFKCRLQRRRLGGELPLTLAARAVRQHRARAAADVVGEDLRPVRQRGLVDIEHDRRLVDGAGLDVDARLGERPGDIAVVSAKALVG